MRPGIMRPAAPPLILATEAIPGGRSYPPMPPQTQRLTISGMRKGGTPDAGKAGSITPTRCRVRPHAMMEDNDGSFRNSQWRQ